MSASLSDHPATLDDVPGIAVALEWDGPAGASGRIVVTFAGSSRWESPCDAKSWSSMLDSIVDWRNASFAEDAVLSRGRPQGAPFRLWGDGADALVVHRSAAVYLVRSGRHWGVCPIAAFVAFIVDAGNEIEARAVLADLGGYDAHARWRASGLSRLGRQA